MVGASIEAVCVVHEIVDGYFHPTAIDKRPVAGAVRIDELGPMGDQHVDKAHGGRDAAVYVYAAEDAAYFAQQLDREIPPGLFGDNVRSRGLDVTSSKLGERWWLGEPGTGVLLEVRKPRTPCHNFSMRMGIEGFHVGFNRTGRVGAMCRVLEPGVVRAGDVITVDHEPDHEVSIGVLVTGMTPAQAQGLLDSEVSLTSAVRAKAQRYADRG
ncbi:MAG TPA: MOSC domain-containing protein [Nocardioides sp.]|jgi:MOSC domain-containing protein YiiM|nr:MOSC domain-containing protein [Nocardioides sp.]